MRILHCLRAPVGGLFRHVLDLAAEQARLGHAVGILADSKAADKLTEPNFDRIASVMRLGIVRIPILRQPGFSDLAAARSVAAHARRLSLDVLHGHGAKGGGYARLASAAMRLSPSRPAVFYTPHGGSLNIEAGGLGGRFLHGLERQFERVTDGLIFESRFAAGAYAAMIGKPHAAVRVIHNGLAPADFETARAGPGATDLLFVGELRGLKGVDVLIDAVAAVNAERPVTATIVGAGPDAAQLEAQVKRLGLKKRVRFTGALPARDAFKLGRIMVVPSLKESFPYTVLEAAAAGLPVIATSVGGIPEIVAGTDTPLVDAGSRPALANAIRAALADPEMAAARANRLKTNVGAKFTIDVMASAVLDFYREHAR